MHPLPTSFLRNIRHTFGQEGILWLDKLPRLLREIQQRWQLTIEPPYNLSYNYVAPAVRSDGEKVVIKFGIPRAELRREIVALRLYAGYGMVRLIDSDLEQCIMLLERLEPGWRIGRYTRLNDDEATRAVAQLIPQLQRPIPDQRFLRPVTEWADGLRRAQVRVEGIGSFPRHLMQTAEQIFADLLVQPLGEVVIHGDLHQDNVLASKRQPWIAIDPKGMWGDPAWETGAWLRNPWRDLRRMSETELEQLLMRRIAIFDEMLGYGQQRILYYGIAITILSAWWSYEEDSPYWRAVLPTAEALIRLAGHR